MQSRHARCKNRLSSLVAAAEQGEEVILTRDGMAVAKIVKFNKPKLKPPGRGTGSIAVSPDWNSAATNALVEGLFYGERFCRKPRRWVNAKNVQRASAAHAKR